MPDGRSPEYQTKLGRGSKFSRRRVLEMAAGVVLAPLAAPVIDGHTLSPKGRRNKSEDPSDDLLTTEELQSLGITINQTPNVQLYLSRGALEIPIFKDAATHKINGLIISLIDSDRISWGNIDKLPDEPKTAWQQVDPDENPEKWTESTWQKVRKYQSDLLGIEESLKNDYEKDLSDILNGQREKLVRQSIDTFRSLLQAKDSKTDPEKVRRWSIYLSANENELSDLLNGQEEMRTRQKIKSEERVLKQTQDSLQVLAGLKDEAIKFFKEYGLSGAQGEMIRPDPNGSNKAFIFLCVGGEVEPDPKQSFPGPQQFSLSPDKNSYSVFSKDELPGFIIRHEAGHYEGKDPDYIENENLADRAAYERLIEAWKKYQQTGDATGYPFVFVSKRGVTVTQKNPGAEPVKVI